MKESVRVFILKLLAVIAKSIFIYPPVLVARTAAFTSDGGVAGFLFYMALILSGFMVGHFAVSKNSIVIGKIADNPLMKFLLFKNDKAKRERNISAAAAYLTLVFPVLAALIVFNSCSIWRVLFEVVFAFLPYFISLKGAFQNYSAIFKKSAVYFGFFIIAISIIVANYYNPASYLKPYLFTISYFYIFAFLILKNSEDIDRNIFIKKHVEKSILPKNMRRFNTIAVIILYTVIILLFNFKTFVMGILNIIGGGLRNILIAIFSSRSNPQIPGVGVGPRQEQPLAPPAFFSEPEIHPYWNFISNVVMYFMVLYIVFHIVMFIIRRAPQLLSKLAALLRRIFSWKKIDEVPEVRDYDDETEIIIPQDHGGHKVLRNRIRSAKKELKSIRDPVERVRYIYGSVIRILYLFGIAIDKSDTTVEIHSKSSHINGIDPHMLLLTESYNLVRYGDLIPDTSSLKDTEKNYDIIIRLLKK